MKNNKLSSIIFLILCLVLVSIMVTGCGKRSVDEEYEYNTVIETNDKKPVNGEVQIDKITGYTEVKDQTFLELPYAIDNTDLVITSIGKFSGVVTDSGESEEVADILAVIIKNNSDQILSFSSLTFEYGMDKTASFNPTNLPPSQSSVVFTSAPYVKYSDIKKLEIKDPMAIMTDTLPLLEDVVGVDYKDGNFIITNLTDKKLGDVYVRYKNCVEGNVYLGGATYSVMVSDVQPYETYTVPAEQYNEEQSVIIAVESIKNDN